MRIVREALVTFIKGTALCGLSKEILGADTSVLSWPASLHPCLCAPQLRRLLFPVQENCCLARVCSQPVPCEASSQLQKQPQLACIFAFLKKFFPS